jgi:hypothetical protein
MGKECSPRVPLGERWGAVFMWLCFHTSLRHSVNNVSLNRSFLHWLLISYFALVLPAGQVAGVLASSEVILFSGALHCYTEHLENAKGGSTESHHHPGEHSHRGVDHHHPSSHKTPDPEIPYIHCDPLGLDFAQTNLLIPFVLSEMRWLPDSLHDSRQLVPQNLAIYFRNEPPPTPPPRDLLFS